MEISILLIKPVFGNFRSTCSGPGLIKYDNSACLDLKTLSKFLHKLRIANIESCGSGRKIGRYHANSLMGMHLSDVPFSHLLAILKGAMTDAEKKYKERGKNDHL